MLLSILVLNIWWVYVRSQEFKLMKVGGDDLGDWKVSTVGDIDSGNENMKKIFRVRQDLNFARIRLTGGYMLGPANDFKTIKEMCEIRKKPDCDYYLLIKHSENRCSSGNWGKWSQWGDCDKSCDLGNRHRNRRCAEHGSKMINETKTKLCYEHPCDGKCEDMPKKMGDCAYYKNTKMCKTDIRERLCTKTCGSCDIDECKTNNGGCEYKCHNTFGSYRCECRDGYSLAANNRTCTDVDECRQKNGGCEHKCKNTEGSYHCTCKEGFRLSHDDQRTCNDINECEENNGGCKDICNNTPGSFTCGCKTGYKLQPNKRECGDVNECEINNGDCLHSCNNTRGSYLCACKTGYRLSTNQRNCTRLDECKENNGGCAHECVSSESSFNCVCNEGYELVSDTGCKKKDNKIKNMYIYIGAAVGGLVIILVILVAILLRGRRNKKKTASPNEAEPLKDPHNENNFELYASPDCMQNNSGDQQQIIYAELGEGGRKEGKSDPIESNYAQVKLEGSHYPSLIGPNDNTGLYDLPQQPNGAQDGTYANIDW